MSVQNGNGHGGTMRNGCGFITMTLRQCGGMKTPTHGRSTLTFIGHFGTRTLTPG